MTRLLVVITVVAIAGWLCMPAYAWTGANTMYGQEGVSPNDYSGVNGIDAAHPKTDPASHYTNWKYKYGHYEDQAIYSWDSDAWYVISSSGDPDLKVEADFEMFCAQTINNHKVYFHIGNPLAPMDLTTLVDGRYKWNHPMWVGFSFAGTDKTEASFQKVGGLFTGLILDGMVGDKDIKGADISANKFPARITMDINGDGVWRAPESFGDGSHATQHDTLWWGQARSIPTGVIDLRWKIDLLPNPFQVDGGYHLDPAVVLAPGL